VTHLYTLQVSGLFAAMVCLLTFLAGMVAGHWLVTTTIRRDA
jgi:hypothetical protein